MIWWGYESCYWFSISSVQKIKLCKCMPLRTYLNVKLLTCLCQQLNYTIKNGACLWKYPVLLLRTDRKYKSAYGYQVTIKKEELVLCKHTFHIPSEFCSTKPTMVYGGEVIWEQEAQESLQWLGSQWYNRWRRQKECPTLYTAMHSSSEVVSDDTWTNTHTHRQITNLTWGVLNSDSFQESG